MLEALRKEFTKRIVTRHEKCKMWTTNVPPYIKKQLAENMYVGRNLVPI